MKELAEIKKRNKPHDVLLVVDAMTGQDAVNVAEQFAEVTNFDGVVLSKLDGDSRGGAALSVKAVTGKPTTLSLILTIIGPTVVTLWTLVIGVLLWRRSARAEKD